MKFKLQDKRSLKIFLSILCYILVLSLVFLGLYAIMNSTPPPISDSPDTGTLDVFSQFYAPNAIEMGKENIRAVWIATVSNINYPTKQGLSESELRSELEQITKQCAELGANTIFFQVRPSSDALYKSKLFPASKYVSGKRGESADGEFDSLACLLEIAEAHKISVHAWVNPVRILTGSKNDPARTDELCEWEHAYKHPEQSVIYADGKMYYDIGIPEVRSLIAEGVYEIVENYDIDGVIFDDYFYPYPAYAEDGALADFDDSETYKKYGGGRDIGDFRRDNVSTLVRQCYAAVKKADKSCLFGISPFGVWRNSSEHGGSGTSGLESYSSIYCDTLSFVRERSVDYIAPQLYWEIGNDGCDFLTLSNWWNDKLTAYKMPFIPTLAPYRYSEGSYKAGEITNQLNHARALSSYGGCALYGFAALTDRTLPVGNEIISAWHALR